MPAGRSGGADVVRAGLPKRNDVVRAAIGLVIFAGAAPRRVFGKPEETITPSGSVKSRARRRNARLFAKVKKLRRRDSLATRRSPFGLSLAG
jgi:hypothetical protein